MNTLWQVFNFVVIYNFIKLFVLCDFVSLENDFNTYDDLSSENQIRRLQDVDDSRNSVLDSVYDTMKHNYEVKLQQDIHKLNMISDLRNKRNTNEPMNMNSLNYQDYYKNHQPDINRKNPNTFPLTFKSSPKLIPITDPIPPLRRSEYYDEEVVGHYTKCQEKPSVQTFHITDDHDHSKHHPSISMVLLTGLKYLFGGFAILALPFIVLKAIFLPIKFFFFFKTLALLKTFMMLTIFLRFLRLNRRFNNNNNINRPLNNFPLVLPGRYKNKLQTIKDILNSDEIDNDTTEEDYRGEDDVLSKESDVPAMYLNNPFNSTDIPENLVENLAKLIRLKNKKW
ncbi:hypothetical protein PVAND_003589 [Polypedilum vanderplanki]|uniref:Uncharacterized protein n=1 Tax=Polypedilum vanderplanki TaxID=319348 RepID=A0A9J6BVL3_POLVA|nr:hypothetical protein PVAND_003589 [Polypedilum vanderplanki]